MSREQNARYLTHDSLTARRFGLKESILTGKCAGSEGNARYTYRWRRISAVGRPAPNWNLCILISLQHGGGNDDERWLLLLCSRWHIPGQPNGWPLCSQLCAIGPHSRLLFCR